MPHDLSVLLSTGISDSAPLFHVSAPSMWSTKRFPFSIVKQLSGLVLFDTTVIRETGDREWGRPWEKCDKWPKLWFLCTPCVSDWKLIKLLGFVSHLKKNYPFVSPPVLTPGLVWNAIWRKRTRLICVMRSAALLKFLSTRQQVKEPVWIYLCSSCSCTYCLHGVHSDDVIQSTTIFWIIQICLYKTQHWILNGLVKFGFAFKNTFSATQTLQRNQIDYI